MGITINVNQISEEITKCREECFNQCLNGIIISPEPIKSKLKQIFLSNKMNDSNVALISVAIDGQSLNSKPLSVYSTTMSSFVESYSKKIFESAKNELAERRGEEKQVPENTPAKRKIPNAEFLLLDIKKFSDIGKASPTALKGATSKFLSQNAIENVIITNENMKNYDFSAFGVEPTPGMTIGECLLECSKNHIQAQKSEEESLGFDVEDACKYTAGVNYFVGYDKKIVNNLLADKKDLQDAFVLLVNRYNNVMNKLISSTPDLENIDNLSNDIDAEFGKVSALCANYGTEGVAIKSFCEQLKDRLSHTIGAKKDGESLNQEEVMRNLKNNPIVSQTPMTNNPDDCPVSDDDNRHDYEQDEGGDSPSDDTLDMDYLNHIFNANFGIPFESAKELFGIVSTPKTIGELEELIKELQLSNNSSLAGPTKHDDSNNH